MYANLAKGFKGGGFDETNASGNPDRFEFEDEHVLSFEAGAKTAYSNLGIVVNASAFRSKFTDLQVSAFDGTAGGVTVRKTEGTGFPTTPTIDLTEFTDKGYFKITVTSSSADYTIKWVAKANFIGQRLPGSDGSKVYQSLAIYQNGDTIIFQNNDVLEWN